MAWDGLKRGDYGYKFAFLALNFYWNFRVYMLEYRPGKV